MTRQPDNQAYGTPSLVDLGREYRTRASRNHLPLTAAQREWQLAVVALSGKAASFDSDNLLTNEWSTAQPLDVIGDGGSSAYGSYVGVGAMQNLTYASALGVAQAIVLDVRPANIAYFMLVNDLLQTCQSPDEFLSCLFSRPNCRPEAGPWLTPPSDDEVREFMQRIRTTHFDHEFMYEQINRAHELAESLVNEEMAAFLSPGWAAAFMTFCIEQFARFNVDLTYVTWGLGITDRHPTLAHLINTSSPDCHTPTFFRSPAAYERVRKLALEWQIIPAIGDLGDPELGNRLTAWQGLRRPVRAVYSSNVENYLVTRGSWDRYAKFIDSLRLLCSEPDRGVDQGFFSVRASRAARNQREPFHDCVFVQKVHTLIEAVDSGQMVAPSDIYLKVDWVRRDHVLRHEVRPVRE